METIREEDDTQRAKKCGIVVVLLDGSHCKTAESMVQEKGSLSRTDYSFLCILSCIKIIIVLNKLT